MEQTREPRWTGPLISAKMHNMEIRYCPTCGTRADASSNFCGVCGNALPASDELERQRGGQGRSLPTAGCRIPPGRILLMTLLSGGLYQYYWFYRTWAQYRDHTRTEVFPVWHALSLAVPIYSLFRTYAHVQAFKQLMDDAGLRNTISPGWAVAAIVCRDFLAVTSVLATGGLDIGAEITRSATLISTVFFAVALLAILTVILHVQGNINMYWSSQLGPASENASIGKGELAFAIIGGMTWLLRLSLILNAVGATGI